MIKKLRKKFIITALLSIFGLLTVILVIINVVNFSLVEQDADTVIQQIIDNGGGFDDGGNGPGGEGQQQTTTTTTQESSDTTTLDTSSNSQANNYLNVGEFQPTGPNSPETSMTMRYFTIKYVDGVASVERLNISAVNENEAIEWANELVNLKKGWTRTYYRFRVWQNDNDENTVYVTVLDQARELSPSFRVLNVSIVGEIVGVIITAIVLIFISKAFVLPLEKSNRKQKRFINDAKEQLKDPITVLDTQASLLDEDGNHETAEIMHRSIDSLKKLVLGLENLTLYEDDKVETNIEEFMLTDLVNEVSSLYSNEFEKNNKKLELKVDPNVLYKGDRLKIKDLLNIVLDNALKYSVTKASVELMQKEDRRTIIISNDSLNISDGDLDSVFERFYRSEDVKMSGIDGMGLSLSIAKEIVRLHQGRIKAYGENGMFILKIEL